MKRTLLGLVVAALAAGASPASALQACPGPAAKTTVLLSGQGTLESVIVDRKGRLFFTNGTSLMRLDRRDAKPKMLVEAESPGGLAFDADGMLIMGYGNSIANGSSGDSNGPSGLLRIDPDTGAHTVYATGLSMANGLARAPDGAFYASNDVGMNIDKIVAGKTERGWAQVQSGNGLAVDSAGKYLYVNQTFRPAAIQRIDLADPSKVTTYAAPTDPGDLAAGLDGMTRDADDRLFSAANGGGQLWRADAGGKLCLLVDGLPKFPDGPSAVATGNHVGTFPARNLYVVTFDGQLIEVADVAVAPDLRIAAKPRRLKACRRAPVVFSVSARVVGKRGPVRGAEVRFAGRTRKTDARGRARFPGTALPAGRHRAEVTRDGADTAATGVRVVRC